MNKILTLIKNKNFFWNMIGIGFNSFYSMLLIVLITRIDGVAIAGQFSFAFYISSLLQTISNYGGRIFQVTDNENYYEDYDYFSLKIITSITMLIISVIFCILSGFSVIKLTLIFIFTIYRALESISDSLYGVSQKNNRLFIVGISTTVKIILSVVVFIVLEFMFHDITIASTGFVLGFSLIMLFIDLPQARKFSKIKISLTSKIKKLLKDHLMIFLFSFFTLLILNVTRYAVELFLTDEIQAYYGYIVMPASLIALSAQFIMQPVLKKLSDQYNQYGLKSFNKTILYLIKIILFIGVFGSLVMYFIGIDILSILYKIDFLSYRLTLSIMIFAGIFSSITTIISTALTIMRQFTCQLLVYIISSVFSVIISFSMIYAHRNIDSAFIAYFLTMLFQFILISGTYLWLYKKKKAIDSNNFNIQNN